MGYKSNISTITKRITAKIKKLENPTNTLREIGTTLVDSNRRRIHNESKLLNGSNIGSGVTVKSKKLGAYTASYSRKRSKAGKETNKINLNFTGTLQDGLETRPKGKTQVVGFFDTRNSELSEALEDRYGELWGVTSRDEAIINKIIARDIKKAIG